MNGKEAAIAFVVITVVLALYSMVMPKIFGHEDPGQEPAAKRNVK